MILLSLVVFAQLLVLNCKETLVNGDKSALLPKLSSVQNGGKKVIELKISDKKDCETICEKHWLKTFCKLKTQCSAVSKCKKEKCSCKLKLKCENATQWNGEIVSEIVELKSEISSFEVPMVPMVEKKKQKLNPKIGIYRTLKTGDVRLFLNKK